jgi:hypothetical protein
MEDTTKKNREAAEMKRKVFDKKVFPSKIVVCGSLTAATAARVRLEGCTRSPGDQG